MNKPISALPMAAVAAQRKAPVVPASTPSSADPPMAGVKGAADSVSISEAGRMQASVRGGVNSNNALATQTGSSSMTKAERIMTELKASFMTKEGDEGFDAKLDFNRDGMINAGDLGMLRQKMADNGMAPGPVADEPPAAATVDSIRNAFFTREGEDGFDAAADLNGDGVINVRDLGMLRQSQDSGGEPTQPVPAELASAGAGAASVASMVNNAAVGVEPVTTPAADVAPLWAALASEASTGVAATQGNPSQAITSDPGSTRQNLLDALRDAFFSRAGDDRFDAALDSNGDGRLNVADFVSIRDSV